MRRHISNFFYILIVQCGNYIFPIITIPLVSRIFGPELIGRYNYLLSITSYFGLLVAFSFNYTALRRVSKSYAEKDAIFSSVFFSQIFLGLASSLLFLLLIYKVDFIRENLSLSLICFVSCLASIFNQVWIYQTNSDFKILTMFSLFSKLISMLAIILLIKNKGDLNLYAGIVQFTLLSTSLLTFVFSIYKYNIRIIWVSCSNMLSFIASDSYVFLSSVISNLYTTTGIVLLGHFSSSFEVGIYSSAQKIIDLMRNFSFVPLNMLLLPLVSKGFRESLERGLEIVQKLMPFFTLFCVFAIIFIFLAGRYVIFIFFGDEFASSVQVLSVLSIGFVALFFGLIIGGQVILNLHYDKQFVFMQVFVALISLSLNFYILPFGGSLTTASVWSLSELIMTTLQIYFLHKKGINVFNLKYFLHPVQGIKGLKF